MSVCNHLLSQSLTCMNFPRMNEWISKYTHVPFVEQISLNAAYAWLKSHSKKSTESTSTSRSLPEVQPIYDFTAGERKSAGFVGGTSSKKASTYFFVKSIQFAYLFSPFANTHFSRENGSRMRLRNIRRKQVKEWIREEMWFDEIFSLKVSLPDPLSRFQSVQSIEKLSDVWRLRPP